MNIRQACEAVVNASPSDYEAACEVWTRVCTPQAVLAALKQLEDTLGESLGRYHHAYHSHWGDSPHMRTAWYLCPTCKEHAGPLNKEDVTP